MMQKQIEISSSSEQNTKVSFLSKAKQLSKNINSLPTLPKLLLTTLPFLIIISLIVITTYRSITTSNNKSNINAPENVNVSQKNNNEQPYNLNNINDTNTKENPINGVLMSEEDYNNMIQTAPIAVMIGNNPEARPQSGLTKADIVYETLVEGGITRYMPIFWSQKVDKIGPIRSARVYFIELLKPYDALYVHIGYAYLTNNDKTDALKALSTYKIKHTDQHKRISTRTSPNNAYTSTTDIIELYKSKNLNYKLVPGGPTFKNDATEEDRGNSKKIYISFIDGYYKGTYDIVFEYNKEKNTYDRYLNNELHKDEETKDVISPKTVIIQKANFQQTFDEKGHVIIDVVGSGEGIILMDGKVVEITWEKKTAYDHTKYYYKGTTNEVQLNRGQIWVSIVPKDRATISFGNE